MTNWMRRALRPGLAMLLVSGTLAACADSPVAPGASASRIIIPARDTVAMVRDTLATARDTVAATPTTVADRDTSSLWTPNCSLNNYCAPTDSVRVPEPGGTVTIGTFNPTWSATQTVGQNTYKYQMGLTTVGGSFVGLLFKNGAFAGYWGYCLFINAANNQYKTTDPATGNTYTHWENHELNSAGNPTGEMYHYVYDPQTNTLKVYHRQRDGSTSLIYQGAPIQDHGKLPPRDPAPGAGPFTNENQYPSGRPVPTVPTASTTPTGTTTTGGVIRSDTTATANMPYAESTTRSGSTAYRSIVVARPVINGRVVRP